MLAAPGSARTAAIRAEMRDLTARLSLGFRRGRQAGEGALGTSSGNSIEFLDHRPYQPGDDPRRLDWSAYARTGHHTVKLFEEEVRTLVDVAVDLSPSMGLTEAKATRTLELTWFTVESALRHGASVRLLPLHGPEKGTRREEPLEAFFEQEVSPIENPSLLPWRGGASRVVISDLLFDARPESLLGGWCHGATRPFLLVPFAEIEAAPPWKPDSLLQDVESKNSRELRVSAETLERYQRSYRAHFDHWQRLAIAKGAVWARFPETGPLSERLSERTQLLPSLIWS